jgi:hypothetical protein
LWIAETAAFLNHGKLSKERTLSLQEATKFRAGRFG